MKFTSNIHDKVVSSENGFLTFRNGSYETTNKQEIKALEKAKNVVKLVDVQLHHQQKQK